MLWGRALYVSEIVMCLMNSLSMPQVIRTVAGNMEVGHLYCRLVPLVLLLVDGNSLHIFS